MTFVDIAGYFDVLATLRVRTHFAVLLGATNRDAEMEHSPDSDQDFFPFEIVFTKNDNGVLDFFDTFVFNTVNPGRATTFTEVVLLPADVCDTTENEYSVPLDNPATVHVVAAVVHTTIPLEFVTTYVTGNVLVTADHDSVTDLLATLAVIATGDTGGPCGMTVCEEAPFPFAFEAITETMYCVPFVSPVKAHELAPVTVQRAAPGDAVTT